MRITAKALFIGLFIVLMHGCATIEQTTTKPSFPSSQTTQTDCHIVYDAGSSGTRLYIYQQQGEAWVEHAGPKVSALADPVRSIRGKSPRDLDAVTTEVVAALDSIQQDGPLKDGKPKWQAFDWSKQCRPVSANVFATAGMRIAEQENRAVSATLWSNLKQKLQAKVGNNVAVNARTLTGFEEGLYAWLAARSEQKDNQFGIVEMGGASTQIAFPCTQCNAADEAVKTVLVDGKPLQMYSYSFLGLGQDEAPKSLGLTSACAYGVKTIMPTWQENMCAQSIRLTDKLGIRDPYNFAGNQRGAHEQVPSRLADAGKWYLTGAFNYMDDKNIDTCCGGTDKCFEEQTSCFRAVYLKEYLRNLDVPADSAKMDVSWTRGAVQCTADDCLQQAKPPACDWTNKGCLQ